MRLSFENSLFVNNVETTMIATVLDLCLGSKNRCVINKKRFDDARYKQLV
jgi:hypothetical protein